MWPWILILLIPAIAGCFKSYDILLGKKRHVRVSLIIVFVVLFIFRAFRKDSVGGDLETYKALFYYIGSVDWKIGLAYPGYEIGFLVYLKVIYCMVQNFNAVLIVTALIYTIGLVKFIYSNSPDPEFSIYIYISLYLFGSSFNNERQAISIALLMMSYAYVKKRNIYGFLGFVFVAALFHATSIVFIPVYFLYRIKPNKKFWLASAISTVVVLEASPLILNFIISHFYTKYSGIDLMSGGGYAYYILLVLVLIVGIVLIPNDELYSDDNINTWGQMITIASILQIFSFTMGYFYRLVILYSVAMVIYIPIMIEKLDMQSRFISKVLIIVLLGGYYILELSTDSLSLVPYGWRI